MKFDEMSLDNQQMVEDLNTDVGETFVRQSGHFADEPLRVDPQRNRLSRSRVAMSYDPGMPSLMTNIDAGRDAMRAELRSLGDVTPVR